MLLVDYVVLYSFGLSDVIGLYMKRTCMKGHFDTWAGDVFLRYTEFDIAGQKMPSEVCFVCS